MEQPNKSASKAGLVVAAIVVLLGIGFAVYMVNNDSGKKDTDSTQTTADSSAGTNDTTNTTEKAVVGSTVITFTDEGFDKSTYTSKDGEAVTVKNESSMDLQFSSDDHPTHLEHQELNMDILGPGESGTFTPAGTGTYKFHDHINDQFGGTLVVQ